MCHFPFMSRIFTAAKYLFYNNMHSTLFHVLQLTFAKSNLPSPLAKREGLCAALYVVCSTKHIQMFFFAEK